MTLENIVEQLFEKTNKGLELSSKELTTIESIIDDLDKGLIKVVEQEDGIWKTNVWVKKAILLYFKSRDVETFEAPPFNYRDCIPLKETQPNGGSRVVPGAVVRYGCFLESRTVAMPSFINIGAYVSEGTMVDTWATVGSCAYIGKNVHLSGGVGIGGVLEPISNNPVIIEDDCFIGSRAIIVEGVRIGKGAVIGAGVTITASTPIIDVSHTEEKVYKGIVPPNSVVIAGTRTKSFPAGDYQVPCALIIGNRSERTDSKVELDQTFRR